MILNSMFYYETPMFTIWTAANPIYCCNFVTQFVKQMGYIIT